MPQGNLEPHWTEKNIFLIPQRKLSYFHIIFFPYCQLLPSSCESLPATCWSCASVMQCFYQPCFQSAAIFEQNLSQILEWLKQSKSSFVIFRKGNWLESRLESRRDILYEVKLETGLKIAWWSLVSVHGPARKRLYFLFLSATTWLITIVDQKVKQTSRKKLAHTLNWTIA